MNHSRTARIIATVIGVLLFAVGLLHDFVNIAALRRALARGEIARRLGPQLIVNVVFAGFALSLLGFFLILNAPELAKGNVRHGASRLGSASSSSSPAWQATAGSPYRQC